MTLNDDTDDTEPRFRVEDGRLVENEEADVDFEEDLTFDG